jgi:hypothetical protein
LPFERVILVRQLAVEQLALESQAQVLADLRDRLIAN